MSKDKPILVEIDTVRIIRDNSMNLAIYQLEDVYNSKEKRTVKRYRFKGFYRTIAHCLDAIVEKDLLVDEKQVHDIESYLKQIDYVKDSIYKAIERLIK